MQTTFTDPAQEPAQEPAAPAPQDGTAGPPAPVEEGRRVELDRLLALWLEELLTDEQFLVLSGLDPSTVPLLAQARAVEVERARMAMQNTGVLARLGALQDQLEVLGTARVLMRDTAQSPRVRLDAAAAIARIGGYDKPPAEAERQTRTMCVTITFAGAPDKTETFEGTVVTPPPDPAGRC